MPVYADSVGRSNVTPVSTVTECPAAPIALIRALSFSPKLLG